MFNKKNFKSEIVKEYLTKYPNDPSLTVAKRIYKDYSLAFKDVDAVYRIIRYYKGKSGDKDRVAVNKETTFYEGTTYNFAPFEKIPESYENIIEPYHLPIDDRKQTNILLLSDIHFPYHSVKTIKAAIKYGIDKEVDIIYLNGDILDFYQISDFGKDPSKPRMKTELELGRWFLKSLRETFPNAKIYYKIGNHEMRLERWLRLKAYEWIDCDEFRLEKLLNFEEYNVTLIDKFTYATAGKLKIIHGHEYKGGGGQNPAKSLFAKAHCNLITSHFHRTSTHIIRTLEGDYHGVYTTGCMSELSPEYSPYNNWNNGFALISVFPDQTFSVENKIVNNNGEIL